MKLSLFSSVKRGSLNLCVCQQPRRVRLLLPYGLQPTRLLCPWGSPGKDTGVDCHHLLQGIFPIQVSNPGVLHCRQILYHVSHQGSPFGSIINIYCTLNEQLICEYSLIPDSSGWTNHTLSEFSPLLKFQTQVSHFLNSLKVRMAVLESLQHITEKAKRNQTKPH